MDINILNFLERIDMTNTIDSANIVADKYIVEMGDKIGIPLSLVKSRENELGWVYFYQSQRYLETGRDGDMLAGNAPFLIFRDNLEVEVLGTARDVEFYVEEIRKKKSKL